MADAAGSLPGMPAAAAGVLLSLLLVHAGLGAIDTLYNHEWRERLPTRPEAAGELRLHALRSLHFATLFAALAWWDWTGAWALAPLAVVASEYAITVVDSLAEDRSRRLSATERVTHMLLSLNTGLYAAVLAWIALGAWWPLADGVRAAGHPRWLSLPLTAAAAGALAWALRDALASRRMARQARLVARA